MNYPLIIILKITRPELETPGQAETLIYRMRAVKREDAVTLSGDETCKGQRGKRVIKGNCKSTDNHCSKCVNVYSMLAKAC